MTHRSLPALLFFSGVFSIGAAFFLLALWGWSLANLVLGLAEARNSKQTFFYAWLYSTGQFLVGVLIYVSMQRFAAHLCGWRLWP